MSGNIDQISHKIGALEERQKSLERTVERGHDITNRKLDNIIEKFSKMEGAVTTAHRRIDTVDRKAEDYVRTKRRALYVLLSAGGGGALLGAGGTAAAGGGARELIAAALAILGG